MALQQIQMPGRRQEETTLDKIAKGLGIAQAVMGTALAIPKFIQEREDLKKRFGLEERKVTAAEKSAGQISPTEARASRELGPTQPAAKSLYESLFPGQPVPETQGETMGLVRAAQQRQTITPYQEKQLGFKEKEIGLREQQIREQARRDEEKAGKKKELSQPTIQFMNEGRSIPNALQDLRGVIESKAQMFGPIEGRARAVNPYDTEAQAADAEIRAVSQSYGRFKEGGVLRKEDEAKYRRMFPQLSDTPEVAKRKLDIVENDLRREYQTRYKGFEDQGFDMTGMQLTESAEKKSGMAGDVDGDGKISQAEKWVMDNPDDPKVPDVIKAIKMRKGGK